MTRPSNAEQFPGYAERARLALASYIEGSTRFEPQSLHIAEGHYQAVHIGIEVVHQVRTHLDEQTEPGHPTLEDQDLVASSDNEFDALSETLRAESAGQFKVINHLARQIAGGPYGDYVGDTDYGAYPRSVHYTHDCEDCAGEGEVTCNTCGGRGEETCVRCMGMGHTYETRWETDHDGNSTSTSEYELCNWCMGSGRESCTRCHGRGLLVCGECEGKGELTETATPAYVVHSRYRLNRIDIADKQPGGIEEAAIEYALKARTELPELGQGLARIDHREVEARKNARQVVEHVAFACPFYKATVNLNGQTAAMEVFGETCRIANAKGLIETLVRPDLDHMRAEVERMNLLNGLTSLRSKKAVQSFMASEIHQQLVAHAPHASEAEPIRQLADKLANALPMDYLNAAIESLEQFATGINRLLKIACPPSASFL